VTTLVDSIEFALNALDGKKYVLCVLEDDGSTKSRLSTTANTQETAWMIWCLDNHLRNFANLDDE
jgi:hypothetical protein